MDPLAKAFLIYLAIAFTGDFIENRIKLTKRRKAYRKSNLMPHARMPDEETAEDALCRAVVHYGQCAKATWMGKQYVDEQLARAKAARDGLILLFPDKYKHAA